MRFPNLVKEPTVKDILDYLPKFREWIETTKLYNVIKEESNPSTAFFSNAEIDVNLVSLEIQMQLKRGRLISTPYDLPIELIKQFYMNSPFFNVDEIKPDEIYTAFTQFKQIDNG